MASIALALTGTAVLAVTLVDAFVTTVSVGAGAGPVTRLATAVLWRPVMARAPRDTGSRALAFAGPVMLVGTIALWVLGLWLGWTLVLLAGDAPVRDATTGAPASVPEIVYYTGFTISTLGVGDYVASTDLARIVSAVAALSGLFVITLGITYVLSVVSAVVARRALAQVVDALGSSPDEIVRRAWDGDRLAAPFVQQVVSVSSALSTSAEQHLAYPVLQYFRARTRGSATPVAVGNLTDAMLVLRATSSVPDVEALTAPVLSTVERYTTTVGRVTGEVGDVDVPPPPELVGTRAAGVPAPTEDALRRTCAAAADVRRALAADARLEGWSWPAAAD